MHRLIVTAIIFALFSACAHGGGNTSANPTPSGRTLGYAQIRTPYAKAAWEEGKLGGVKKALDNRHSQTGKPYPCWNALRPFRGRNLPVSLRVNTPGSADLNTLIQLAQLPADKLDQAGRDGVLSSTLPLSKAGYSTWQVDLVYQKMNRAITGTVIGLVDISESMKVKSKIRTLHGLKDSNIRFEKIFTFSEAGTLSEVSLIDIIQKTPKGHTAVYDNLKVLIEKYPGAEIFVVTDGRDNKSKTTLAEITALAQSSGNTVDFVLTGKNVDSRVEALAFKTGGHVMRDLQEDGRVIQPTLEVVQIN